MKRVSSHRPSSGGYLTSLRPVVAKLPRTERPTPAVRRVQLSEHLRHQRSGDLLRLVKTEMLREMTERRPKLNNTVKGATGRAEAARVMMRALRQEATCRGCRQQSVIEEGEAVCTACGLVQPRPVLEWQPEFDTGGRVTNAPERAGSSHYDRMVYFRERMRQFMGGDPMPLALEIAMMREAWAAHGSPAVDRDTCLALIASNPKLSKKRLLEKWVTFRALLTGVPPPQPSLELVNYLTEAYMDVSRTWDTDPGVHRHPYRRAVRKNIVSLDMCLRQLLLRHSQAVHDLYAPYFANRASDTDYAYWWNICVAQGCLPRVSISKAE